VIPSQSEILGLLEDVDGVAPDPAFGRGTASSVEIKI
jgi:hypothetical protein